MGRAERRAQAKLNRSQSNAKNAREAAAFANSVEDEINRRVIAYGKRLFDSLMTQLLYGLHEEYGFKRKRLERVLDRLYYDQECLNEGYLTEEDMLDVLRKEAKMQITLMKEDDNVVDELLSELKNKKKKPSSDQAKRQKTNGTKTK